MGQKKLLIRLGGYKMVCKDELLFICRERQQSGLKAVGEIDNEKIYQICYEEIEYYTDEGFSRIYTVYNHNFDDVEIEYLDLSGHQVLKYLFQLKEML